MFVIIIFGRSAATIGLIQFLRLFGHAPQASVKELCFICYAGMIRGAIAFGLVLRLDKSLPNRNVIVTTSLSLVIVTTVLYGGTLGLLAKCLLPKPKSLTDLKMEQDHGTKKESLLNIE
jgi:NhaP-type Na+/H+ or K+/H+ antiporter